MKKLTQKLSEAGFVIGLTIAIFALVTNIPMMPIVENGRIRSWQSLTMNALGDIAPGAGQSGVVNVSLVKHGLYDYKSNITRNASMFAWSGFGGEANNTQIGNNVPYGIRFDIVVKVRWNRTHAFNTSNSNWSLAWVQANISMPRFQYQNYSMDEWNVSTSVGWEATQNFMWVQYVLGSGKGTANNGMSINRSERVPQCYFRFWAYY
jgi:hypothetical protein